MDLIQSLEILSNDAANSCAFIDAETQELVFLNTAYLKKFRIYEDFTGTQCCEKTKNYTGNCAFCRGYRKESADYPEERIFSKNLNTYLRANTSLIEVQGRALVMTKYFLTAADEKKAQAKESFESAMTRCLEILAMSDRNESIQSFLELLGHFYQCKLTYIYEFDQKTNSLGSQHIWAEGEIPKNLEHSFHHESMDAFIKWLANDRDKEIISLEYDNDENHDIENQTFFKNYNLDNITINKLWNKDGSLVGIVGVSNCSVEVYDDRLLRAISRFVVDKFNEQSLERALASLNEIDLLTGFFNRSKYGEKLAELHHNSPESLGVLFVNLNGLRRTNEYFGFEVGDIQLKNTAKVLRSFFNDDFYRISGDEFVCFVPDIEKSVFDKKIDALQKNLKIETDESSFAIGHAWERGTYNVTSLVKTADTVMLINKQSFYSSAQSEKEQITNSILQELFEAISQDEFLVYLQPQVQLSDEVVVGAEALIRRFDKKKNKMIYPDQFIPLYEKNSIIRHVDLFVVEKVCRILVNWSKTAKPIPISVNLSRVTLMEHGIVNTITDICDRYSIPHSLIVIEVTERIGLIENNVASSLVTSFQKEGFRLSLDDFGCAYSNIVTLSQISINEVKLDKSLVDHVLSNEKNKVIVKNMLAMCNEFENTSTLAEGIEIQEQADYLKSVHCHLGQGYLYSRPIPHEEFYLKYIQPQIEQ